MNQTARDKVEKALELETHPDFPSLKLALENARSLSPKCKERYKVIELYVRYQSISRVGYELQLDRKTVRKWLNRFQDQGINGLHDRPRSGRRAAITPAAQRAIRRALENPVPSELGIDEWHAKALSQYLGLPYHPVLRFLKSMEPKCKLRSIMHRQKRS